jgi:hypothetical protein
LGKEVHISQFVSEGIKIMNKEIEIQKFNLYDRIKIKYIENIFSQIQSDLYIK